MEALLQSNGLSALIGLVILAFLVLMFMVVWFVVRFRNRGDKKDED